MTTTPDDATVCARVADLLGIYAELCTPSTPLTDLVKDSFRLVEMAIDLQEEYGVIFSQADMRELISVGDLAALIRTRRA